MEIRTKHVRAGFKAGFEPGLEGLKAMEIGAKQYDKEGTLFWTSKPKKKQARKNGPPQYLPMLSPNEGYNETGLTQQSAGPVRELMQEIRLTYLYKGSEFGHWRVTAGWDAFAFRHPSLGQTDVRRLLDSEAHHHKVSPIGTGRLIALVGVEDITKAGIGSGKLSLDWCFPSRPSRPKTKMSCLLQGSTVNATQGIWKWLSCRKKRSISLHMTSSAS